MNRAMIAVVITLQFSSFSCAFGQTLSLSQLPRRAPVAAAELDRIKKAVDPQGKMTEAQRVMFALGQVYQYQLNKGNPEGAARVALQLLQLYRLETIRYSSIAAHASENGDLDTTARAAVKAYANVPDVKDLVVFKDDDGKLYYSYTDVTTGKTIVKGFLTPQQLGSQATGIAPAVFEKLIYEAASLPLSQSEIENRRALLELRRSILNGGFSNQGDTSDLPSTPSPRSPPSINCVTMNEVFGTGSTTHCEPQ